VVRLSTQQIIDAAFVHAEVHLDRLEPSLRGGDGLFSTLRPAIRNFEIDEGRTALRAVGYPLDVALLRRPSRIPSR
jgi:hypothetical protein